MIQAADISLVEQHDDSAMLGQGCGTVAASVDVRLHGKRLLGREGTQRQGGKVCGPIAARLVHG